MPTIFIIVKGNEIVDAKIPLLFLEYDADVNRLIKIEDNYMQYKLCSREGNNLGKMEAFDDLWLQDSLRTLDSRYHFPNGSCRILKSLCEELEV